MAETLLLDPTLDAALRAAGVRSAHDLLALGDPNEPRRFVGFVELPVEGTAGRFHLKRYRYAGWRESRGLLGRGTLWGMPPEINEYRVLSLFRSAGVAAVRPVAACALRRGGRLVAHALLTEAVADARDLDARLHDPDDPVGASRQLRRAVAVALGSELGRLHLSALVHRDCHARNVLVLREDGGVRVLFLDCRRGGRARREKHVFLDLATLDRDLQGVLTRGERRKALAAYLDAFPSVGATPLLGAKAIAKRVVPLVAAIRERLPPPRRP
jgi:tRNA A-37 threonylcarbamoyl transferase component Bud32